MSKKINNIMSELKYHGVYLDHGNGKLIEEVLKKLLTKKKSIKPKNIIYIFVIDDNYSEDVRYYFTTELKRKNFMKKILINNYLEILLKRHAVYCPQNNTNYEIYNDVIDLKEME